MSRLIKILISLAVAVSTCRAHQGGVHLGANETARVALQFSVDLLNKITLNNTDNVVYSPWSVFSTISMLQLGVSDKSLSQHELNQLLHITPETELIHHQVMSRISKEMNSEPLTDFTSSKLKLIQANKVLFNKKIVKLNPAYSNNLSKLYDTSIEPFVLGLPHEFPVHERVNQWVKNTTYGTIQSIADSSLASDPNLALVLLNAAYFKGQWLNVFNTIKLSSFYNMGDIKNGVDAVFMDIKGREFEYAEFNYDSSFSINSEEDRKLYELTKDLNCSVVVLPYNLNDGKNFSMVLILPDELDGIDHVQSKLSFQVLEAILKSLKNTIVNVSLPKFEFDTTIEVPRYLKSMNVNSIFRASYDFKRMFDSDKQFAVDKITHKSRIKVDEKGTEAAGITLTTIFKKVGTRGPSFSANHPFIFMIRHHESNMPLFIGRVNTVSWASLQGLPVDF